MLLYAGLANGQLTVHTGEWYNAYMFVLHMAAKLYMYVTYITKGLFLHYIWHCIIILKRNVYISGSV